MRPGLLALFALCAVACTSGIPEEARRVQDERYRAEHAPTERAAEGARGDRGNFFFVGGVGNIGTSAGAPEGDGIVQLDEARPDEPRP
jgi:hypothetical protein